MKIIKGERASGKTINLIREAAEKDLYIVCYDMNAVEMIVETARKMNLLIRFPITYRELINKKYQGKGIKGFVLEDLDLFLQELFDRKLEAITLDAEWDARNETIECKPFGWLDNEDN